MCCLWGRKESDELANELELEVNSAWIISCSCLDLQLDLKDLSLNDTSAGAAFHPSDWPCIMLLLHPVITFVVPDPATQYT